MEDWADVDESFCENALLHREYCPDEMINDIGSLIVAPFPAAVVAVIELQK